MSLPNSNIATELVVCTNAQFCINKYRCESSRQYWNNSQLKNVIQTRSLSNPVLLINKIVVF